ncbi:MAG: hypothetical protein HKN42_05465 [Granulosicoccus sp.]|nr:hypothetical protein [Granulosicoccus sp.]
MMALHAGLLHACGSSETVRASGQVAAVSWNSVVDVAAQSELIDKLLLWVQENTNYDVSAIRQSPPHINFCNVGERIEYEGERIIVDPDLNAAYDSQLRRINIVGPWDLHNTMDQSILLHELIHDVQSVNRTWYCLQEPEWEAYKLQDAWLAQQGTVSGFDWLYIYFLSRCPRDHHP